MKVKFTYEGKEYAGELQYVIGAGANTHYLIIDGCIRGRLLFSDSFGWQFITEKGRFPEIAKQLEGFVDADETENL